MKNNQLLKSKFWLFPLIYILFFTVEAMVDVFYEHGYLYIYILFVFLSFFILLILAVMKSFKSKTNTHWIAVLVGFLLVFFWQDIRLNLPILMQALKIKLQPQVFSKCIKNATPIRGVGAIEICEHKIYELWNAVIHETIVYDSSDQIVNTHALRSHAWNQAAFMLFHEKNKIYDSGYKATKLFGHFYYVCFSTDLNSDFESDDYPQKLGMLPGK